MLATFFVMAQDTDTTVDDVVVARRMVEYLTMTRKSHVTACDSAAGVPSLQKKLQDALRHDLDDAVKQEVIVLQALLADYDAEEEQEGQKTGGGWKAHVAVPISPSSGPAQAPSSAREKHITLCQKLRDLHNVAEENNLLLASSGSCASVPRLQRERKKELYQADERPEAICGLIKNALEVLSDPASIQWRATFAGQVLYVLWVWCDVEPFINDLATNKEQQNDFLAVLEAAVRCALESDDVDSNSILLQTIPIVKRIYYTASAKENQSVWVNLMERLTNVVEPWMSEHFEESRSNVQKLYLICAVGNPDDLRPEECIRKALRKEQVNLLTIYRLVTGIVRMPEELCKDLISLALKHKDYRPSNAKNAPETLLDRCLQVVGTAEEDVLATAVGEIARLDDAVPKDATNSTRQLVDKILQKLEPLLTTLSDLENISFQLKFPWKGGGKSEKETASIADLLSKGLPIACCFYTSW